MTAITSALRTVDRRWAMMSVVRPADILSMERLRAASVSLSTLLVASSSTSTGASLRTARAIAILWRWPPESLWPPSPMSVFQPSGKSSMKLSASAIRAASMTACSSAFGSP